MREGYARVAGPRSIRESIDVETEEIADAGERWPMQEGVRLSVYEKVEADRVADRVIGSLKVRSIEVRTSRECDRMIRRFLPALH